VNSKSSALYNIWPEHLL